MKEAPYTDPDGYPSWQPDPRTRARDAHGRKEKAARERLQDIQFLIKANEKTLDFLKAEEAEVAAKIFALAIEYKKALHSDWADEATA